MNEQQNRMLTKLEMYCNSHQTSAWTGNGSDLVQLGGKQLLYELEQLGVVSINQIRETWIITPVQRSGLNIHDLMLEEFIKVTDANAIESAEDEYLISSEEDTAPSPTDSICPTCNVAMKQQGEVYTCPICNWVDW